MFGPKPGDIEFDAHYDVRRKLQKWDVWGWSKIGDPGDGITRMSEGMVVAKSDQECPIFGDKVPYKSATLLVDLDKLAEKGATLDDVDYWIGYVQGGGASYTKHLGDGQFAIRSDYHAW